MWVLDKSGHGIARRLPLATEPRRAGVTVPPGVAFTDKPFHLIIRADVTTAIDAKRTPTTQTFTKGEKTWTRNVGGEVAGNRLRDHLCGLWNWAIGYADVTPFARIGGGRSAIKKKAEDNRSRRLRDGEQAGLLKATTDEPSLARLHRCCARNRHEERRDPVASVEAGSLASERASSSRRQDEDEEAMADPDLADAP
jgi:hypothetical protein